MKKRPKRNPWAKEYKDRYSQGRNLANMYADRIKFTDSTFVESDLSNSTFINCRFENVFFVRCKMTFTTFQNCTFNNVIFDENQGLSEYGIRSVNAIEGGFEFQSVRPKKRAAAPRRSKKSWPDRFLHWLLPA